MFEELSVWNLHGSPSCCRIARYVKYMKVSNLNKHVAVVHVYLNDSYA